MTERIDHVAEARRLLAEAQDETETPWQVATEQEMWVIDATLAAASVEASLALVEQQRVANLIALMASAARGVAEHTYSVQDYVEMFNRLNPQVIKALGLNEGENDEV